MLVTQIPICRPTCDPTYRTSSRCPLSVRSHLLLPTLKIGGWEGKSTLKDLKTEDEWQTRKWKRVLVNIGSFVRFQHTNQPVWITYSPGVVFITHCIAWTVPGAPDPPPRDWGAGIHSSSALWYLLEKFMGLRPSWLQDSGGAAMRNRSS